MEVVDTNKTLELKWMYCPSRSIHWGRVCRDLFAARSLPVWPQFRYGQVIDFYQVRSVLWFLCEYWDLQPDDEVLMPAYNCGSEVDPFHAYGVKVIFYPVDKRAGIDTGTIQGLCGPRTRVVYITHYFGWGHNIKTLYAWCQEYRIKVIEDCALALFSRGDEGYLGTNSDAAVFSLKKSLSVPDGAVLVLREPMREGVPVLRRPSALRTFRNMLPFVKSSVKAMIGPRGDVKREIDHSGTNCVDILDMVPPSLPDMPRDYYFDKRLRNWRMSHIASGILRQINPEFIYQKRRENYLYLLEQLEGIPGFSPLFNELPPGVCPLSLVAVVPNRKVLVDALARFGIDAYPWWEGYHRNFDWGEFPDARFLKDQVISLPIHQLLETRHMDYIAKSMKRLLR